METVFGLLLIGLLTAGTALPALLQRYAARLPEAPACPACRGMTSRARPGWLMRRILTALFTYATIRQCVRCGLRGIISWRWAAEPAPRA